MIKTTARGKPCCAINAPVQLLINAREVVAAVKDRLFVRTSSRWTNACEKKEKTIAKPNTTSCTGIAEIHADGAMRKNHDLIFC